MNYINQSFKQKKTVGSWNGQASWELGFPRERDTCGDNGQHTYWLWYCRIGWFSCSYHVMWVLKIVIVLTEMPLSPIQPLLG